MHLYLFSERLDVVTNNQAILHLEAEKNEKKEVKIRTFEPKNEEMVFIKG